MLEGCDHSLTLRIKTATEYEDLCPLCLFQRVRELKNALARFGQHTKTCAKQGCVANKCDCGFFEVQK